MDDRESTPGDQLAAAIKQSAGVVGGAVGSGPVVETAGVATSMPRRHHEIPNQQQPGERLPPIDHELQCKLLEARQAAEQHRVTAAHFARMANEMLTAWGNHRDVLDEADRMIAISSRHSTDMIRHRNRALELQQEIEAEVNKVTQPA